MAALKNWSMIELINLKCDDIYDACRVKRKYIKELKATLNKNRPITTTIEKMNKIKVQFLYILKYIKHNRLILKISGIWENNNKIGLTYKFIY